MSGAISLFIITLVLVATCGLAGAMPRVAEPASLAPGENTIMLTARHIAPGTLRRRQDGMIGTLPLQDAWNGTDLQWYGPVKIGTPPQIFQMVFDTGSPDIILPSVSCTPTQGCTKGVRFNQTASSTFKSKNRPWREDFGTGVGVDPSDHPFASGIVGTDVVDVAGLAVQDQVIGPMNRRSPGLFHDTAIEGIVGLSPGGSGVLDGKTFFANLLSQGKLKQRLFSLYLTPRSVGNAELTLGGVDSSKMTGPITWIPANIRTGAWNITFQSVTANGVPIRTPRRWAIADSGTANMYAPAADVRAIYAALSPNIKQVTTTGGFGLPCSEVSNLTGNITITLSNSQFVIPAKEFSVGEFRSQPGMCQMLFNTEPSLPFWIVGASLMKYYYTVWDVGNSRLGFARTARSP